MLFDGTSRFRLDGKPLHQYCGLACFSEYTVVPGASAVKLASDIQPDVAALIGCAVTTGVGSVLNTAKVEEGSSVTVFGVGGVGLSTVMGAKLAGASMIVAVDLHQSRLDAALSLGATHALLSDEETLVQLRGLTEGRGVDYAFEAAGVPALQQMAMNAIGKGGKLIFSGIAPKRARLELNPADLTRGEKTVMGSYYGSSIPSRDFVLFAEAFREGELPIDRMISRSYRLDEINDAYADMLNGVTVRGVINP